MKRFLIALAMLAALPVATTLADELSEINQLLDQAGKAVEAAQTGPDEAPEIEQAPIIEETDQLNQQVADLTLAVQALQQMVAELAAQKAEAKTAPAQQGPDQDEQPAVVAKPTHKDNPLPVYGCKCEFCEAKRAKQVETQTQSRQLAGSSPQCRTVCDGDSCRTVCSEGGTPYVSYQTGTPQVTYNPQPGTSYDYLSCQDGSCQQVRCQDGSCQYVGQQTTSKGRWVCNGNQCYWVSQ
ncbi:hypothetical protein [Rosistilla oblonga]|uniref:hypothetical protein n=1 Tax=Rosistilla oblonga TaxID=2527990 RepID=UPI003A96D49D